MHKLNTEPQLKASLKTDALTHQHLENKILAAWHKALRTAESIAAEGKRIKQKHLQQARHIKEQNQKQLQQGQAELNHLQQQLTDTQQNLKIAHQNLHRSMRDFSTLQKKISGLRCNWLSTQAQAQTQEQEQTRVRTQEQTTPIQAHPYLRSSKEPAWSDEPTTHQEPQSTTLHTSFELDENSSNANQTQTPSDLKPPHPPAILFWRRVLMSAAVSAMVLVFGVAFRTPLKRNITALKQQALGYLEGPSASDLYMAQALSQQRKAIKFNPAQTKNIKRSYTDNILYTTEYINLEAQNKNNWTQYATRYLVERLEVDENLVAQVLGKEAALLKILTDLSRNIDKRQPHIGISKMRGYEKEFEKFLRSRLGDHKSRKFKQLKISAMEGFVR